METTLILIVQLFGSEFEIYVRKQPELKNVLEKYGINSLITKMHTERKFRSASQELWTYILTLPNILTLLNPIYTVQENWY